MFDEDLKQLDEIDFGPDIAWIELNGNGSVLLVGFGDHIDAHATAGNIAPLFKLPVSGTSVRCCVFIGDERTLCIASWDSVPRLTAWDLESRTIVAEAPLPDRGGEGYSLVRHPEGEAMAAVAFSGQSEEWMFWAHFGRGRLRVFSEPEIEDVALPCFHPTGRELCSYHERLGLCRMRFPSGELLASVQPEVAFPDNPEDTFSYDIHFFRTDRILVWQTNLALFEFDAATLQPTGIVLTGTDGMKFGENHFFSEQSWKLAGRRLLTSDCLHERRFSKRTDTLRLWDASELCGKMSQADAALPYTKELLASSR